MIKDIVAKSIIGVIVGVMMSVVAAIFAVYMKVQNVSRDSNPPQQEKQLQMMQHSASLLDEAKAIFDEKKENGGSKSNEIVRNIPHEGQQTKIFTWTYDGKAYTIAIDLYDSLYHHYFTHQKIFKYSGDLPSDWKEKYLKMFLYAAPGDTTLDELAQRLLRIGLAHDLSDDQIVELVVSFVQSIPYDTPKKERIAAGVRPTEETLVYPYETLYQNTGVCSDKSVLLYRLLHSLGYGVALLAYDRQQHMSVGIQCPQEYASYENGYCYIETTNTLPIGVIPSLNENSRRAVAPVALLDAQRLSDDVQVYFPTKGKVYTGIVRTRTYVDELNNISVSIQEQKEKIAAKREKINRLSKTLNELTRKLQKYKKAQEWNKYNAHVDAYNDTLKEYKERIKKINKRIDEYNATIRRYNNLLRKLVSHN